MTEAKQDLQEVIRQAADHRISDEEATRILSLRLHETRQLDMLETFLKVLRRGARNISR